jgi:tRNA (cmo5U34)-methyltransferase
MSAPTPTYRWNTSDAAEAYDRAAPLIHPHYATVQDQILSELPFGPDRDFVAVDLGAGSGRLAERILLRFPAAQVVLVDQSDAFLALAERRLGRFGSRASCLRYRLQDDWTAGLPSAPNAIVSTSAIHHLEPAEKSVLFGRIFTALAAGGIFINGDEYRPVGDAEYRALLEKWSAHMRAALDAGRIPTSFRATFDQWQDRNLRRFGEPKSSGDDCLETIAANFGYLREAGFADVETAWSEQLWGVVVARKTSRGA